MSKCAARQDNSAPKRRKQALHPVEREDPLTGTELGTSLRLYSLLLARDFWPRSSHTEWEEERRFTRDRKGCGDRETRSSSVLLHLMHPQPSRCHLYTDGSSPDQISTFNRLLKQTEAVL